MASLFSLLGVILWSFSVFRPWSETLDTLPSHRSEVLSYYRECLLRASHGDVGYPQVLKPLTHPQQVGHHGAKAVLLFVPLPRLDRE
jgi:hypothetical protein